MRRSSADVNARRDAIIEILENKKTCYTEELAKMLGASDVTVRRDLDTLASEGKVARFNGGAALPEKASDVDSFEKKLQLNSEEKILIAKKAAEFIHENDMVFLNSGTTVLYIPEFIDCHNVTIITNNVRMPYSNRIQDIGVTFTGGALNAKTMSLGGRFALMTLKQVYGSICILGVNGIDAESGVTTSVYQETEINELMLERCKGKKIVVADSNKIGKARSYISSKLDSIDYLITTSKADSDQLSKISKKGVRIILADQEK